MVNFPKNLKTARFLFAKDLRPLTEHWDDHSSRGRQSAVLFLIAIDPGGDCFLVLTKRSQTVRTHKGEIGFAGGHREVLDQSPRDTAVREAFEEIGIDSSCVTAYGELECRQSLHGTAVVPVFASCYLADITFRLQKSEVAELILAPLSLFHDDKARTQDYEYKGRKRQTFIYDYGEHRVWGLTAHIIAQAKLREKP